MTEKTLGQVAWEAIGDVPWESLQSWQQKDCETMAQAVVEAVREQVAAWVEPQRNDVPATGAEFAAAIRNMKL